MVKKISLLCFSNKIDGLIPFRLRRLRPSCVVCVKAVKKVCESKSQALRNVHLQSQANRPLHILHALHVKMFLVFSVKEVVAAKSGN